MSRALVALSAALALSARRVDASVTGVPTSACIVIVVVFVARPRRMEWGRA